MKNCLLFVALVFSFTFDVRAANADTTSNTICQIVKYTQDLGGPMITIVIIGAALLAIFGRMPWPQDYLRYECVHFSVFLLLLQFVKAITEKETIRTLKSGGVLQIKEL